MLPPLVGLCECLHEVQHTKIDTKVDHKHTALKCPYIVDTGDSLQIWRKAVNVLKKQLLKADKGFSSILGAGQGANHYSLLQTSML
jgi:hypothetical protein